jgi:2-C-methyl-D-erythritol 4-phosphate cytidylyltransferase/2-C-methyl-D-erythritol 2,4-cyclodiphosphate synthase
MTVAAVIVAAGFGLRAGGEQPKQYQSLSGKPVIWWALKAFCEHPLISFVQPVIGENHLHLFKAAVSDLALEPAVMGGNTRQDSCRIGIETLERRNPKRVLIHDAARPFVSADIIDRVVAGLDDHAAVVPGLPISETLKRTSEGVIAETVDRRNMWVAQTPQGFDYARILEAHRKALLQGINDFTDDAAVAAFAGMTVAMVMGAEDNRKLTTMQDLEGADRAMRARQFAGLGDIRTGQGIDIHAFAPGDHIVLCGVPIPHTHRLAGHSDADAALHALTDAILGAIGEADIGTHFPPTDQRWKDAPSTIFVSRAMELLAARGGRVAHADLTILCEEPRIAPRIGAMKAILGPLLGIASERIAIKATTTEGLGFIGQKEGLAAFATVTVRLPG